MNDFFEFFRYLTDSEEVLRTGGLVAVTLIVFAENGLFFA
ncbi:MAG: DedA family protein, partial [Sphingobacteriaceae bacterium]|nr:DedA family protein [Cytophagaceae bacterium]